MGKKLLSILLILITVSNLWMHVSSTTYIFVSTLSSNTSPNCGSILNPCGLIQSAVDNANGETTIVLLNDGVYNETGVQIPSDKLCISFEGNSSNNVAWNCAEISGGALNYIGNSSYESFCQTQVHIRNITFKNCLKYNHLGEEVDGGAIFMNSSNLVTLENCNFINCSISYGQGGAVFVERSIYAEDQLSVKNCLFENCSTTCIDFNNYHFYGGGSLYYSGSNLTIINSKFINSTAVTIDHIGDYTLVGGAVFSEAEHTNIYACYFIGNKILSFMPYNVEPIVPAEGGAIFVANQYGVIINNCTFHLNSVHGPVRVGGGAVSVASGISTVISNSTFHKNQAVGATTKFDATGNAIGGALLLDSNLIKLENLTFSENVAIGGNSSTINESSAAGGAMAVFGLNLTLSNVLAIHNSVISGQTSYSEATKTVGGAFTIEFSYIMINNVQLFNNTCIGANNLILGSFSRAIIDIVIPKEKNWFMEVNYLEIVQNEVTGGNADILGGTVAGIFNIEMYSQEDRCSDSCYNGRINISSMVIKQNKLIPGIAATSGGGGGTFTIHNKNPGNATLLVTNSSIEDCLVGINDPVKYGFPIVGASLAISGEGITSIFSRFNITRGIAQNFHGGTRGAAVFANNTKIFWSNSSISDCAAISGDSGISSGGAIFLIYSTLVMENVALLNNSAFHYDHQLNSIIHANEILQIQLSHSLGGAVFASNYSSIFISNSLICGNYAEKGGFGFIDETSDLTITSSLLSGNDAVIGGAIAFAGRSNQNRIYNVTFRNNNARNGGCISIDKIDAPKEANVSSVIISKSNFIEGTAEFGGVFWSDLEPGLFEVGDSNFTKNSAYGGSIWGVSSGNATSSTYTCPGCIFEMNFSGYGYFDGKLASPPTEVEIFGCPYSSLFLNNSTFTLNVSLQDSFGSTIKGKILSGANAQLLISPSCTLTTSSPIIVFDVYSGIGTFSEMYIQASNGSVCNVTISVLLHAVENIRPMERQCTVLLQGCPSGSQLMHGNNSIDYCYIEPASTPLCDITCFVLLILAGLVMLLFLILVVIVSYFIWKRIQKNQRIKKAIPSLLKGKQLFTMLEILNDPDIPVLPRDRIRIANIIGSGAQGMVWKGVDARTNTTVAVKQMHIGSMDNQQLQLFLSEIKLASILNHKNICSFIGVILLTDNEIGMVSKFMNRGTLRSLIYEKGSNIPANMRLNFLIDISRGLEYLHSMKLVHRDLKPDNILIDDDWSAVITDFGCTTVLIEKYRTQTLVGTPIYIAPELLAGSKSNQKVDIYSLGVIINEVISMTEPYSSEWYKHLSNHELINMVISGDARPELDSNYHPQLVALLQECWSAIGDNRPSALEIKRRLKRLDPNQLFQGWNKSKKITSLAAAKEKISIAEKAPSSDHDHAVDLVQSEELQQRAATGDWPLLRIHETEIEMKFYGTS